jgi:flavin reductase (DIM6/NTAB) family NADH-FMN oxidoreductase RutF
MTANSFSSVSLNPPLILWGQSLSSPSHPVFRDAERFAVNILAEDQVDISKRFATSGQDKFSGLEVGRGLGGIPLTKSCSAYLECHKLTSYPGGDHAVFFGRVERIVRTKRKSLVFGGGDYLLAYPQDLGSFSLDFGMASLSQLKACRHARGA